MKGNLDQFEQSLRDVIDLHEVQYDPSQWSKLEKNLPKSASFNWSNVIASAAVVASLVVLTTAWYYLSDASASSASLNQTTHKERNISVFLPSSSLAELLTTRKNLNNIDSDSSLAFEANETSQSNSTEKQVKATTNQNNSSAQKVNPDAAKALANEDSIVSSDDLKEVNEVETSEAVEEDLTAFGVDFKNACEGTSVQFELMSEISEGNYLWNFGDGHFSNEANPSHVYNNQGVYDITLSVTSKDDGQIRTRTIEDLIVINPTPVALFDWTFEDNQNQKPTVKIENNSQHADHCDWTVDNNNISSEINPSIALTTKGEHEVMLTVTNQFGCEATKYKYINVDKDYKLLAREQISPNGDRKYDSFMPEALMFNDQAFKLMVYNNQELIFESTNADHAWEGDLPDGSKATEGQQFPWVVILYHENGEEEYYSGTITIIP